MPEAKPRGCFLRVAAGGNVEGKSSSKVMNAFRRVRASAAKAFPENQHKRVAFCLQSDVKPAEPSLSGKSRVLTNSVAGLDAGAENSRVGESQCEPFESACSR